MRKEVKKMKTIATAKDLSEDNTHSIKSAFCRAKRRWTTLLFGCAVLGISSGILGLSISLLNFLGLLARNEGAGRLSVLLVALAFPLMMFGAHAMDKIAEIEKAEKSRTLERERRKNYSPEQWKKDEHTEL